MFCWFFHKRVIIDAKSFLFLFAKVQLPLSLAVLCSQELDLFLHVHVHRLSRGCRRGGEIPTTHGSAACCWGSRAHTLWMGKIILWRIKTHTMFWRGVTDLHLTKLLFLLLLRLLQPAASLVKCFARQEMNFLWLQCSVTHLEGQRVRHYSSALTHR